MLRSFDSDTVDLIATDPPFNKKRDAFEGNLKGGGKAKFKDNWHWVDPDPNKGKRHDPDAVENHADWLESIEKHHHRVHALITATRDVYGDDMAAFLCFMGVRLLEMHRVLKPTGSIYLHCDPTASHYLKGLMDAVFGKQNFRNEIVWRRTVTKKGNLTRGLAADHDLLLRYSKSDNFVWNADAVTQPYDMRNLDERTAKQYSSRDSSGRLYSLTSITAPVQDPSSSLTYEVMGVTRTWRWTRERMQKAIDDGIVVQTKPGNVPRQIRYLEDQKGKTLNSVWIDIPALHSQAIERTGYPTQKPLALYERIVRASSDPGDIVLDPFAGCATTAVAAQRLRRDWVAIDIEVQGYDLTKQRMSDERALDQQAIVIGPAITDLPVRRDDGRTAADPLNPKPRKQRPPSKIDKDRDHKLDILIAEFGLQCWGCGFTPPGDAGQRYGRNFFELDHIKPQAELGTHDILNRAILCGPCNRRKGGFGGTLADLREQNETAQRLYGRLLDMAKVIDWHVRYKDREEERRLL